MKIFVSYQFSIIPIIFFILAVISAINTHAHEVRPGFLEIKEREPGLFDVKWKVPTRGNRVLAITPVLPDNLKKVGLSSIYSIPGAWVELSTYESGSPILGKTISIDGLNSVQTDVLLQINMIDGTNFSAILKPNSPSYNIPMEPAKFGVALSY